MSRRSSQLTCSAPAIEAALSPIAPLPPGTAERLALWTAELNRWQRAQRLVGWRKADDLLREGLARAWAGVHLLAERPGTLLDLGSGAGLPGLVAAAADPERTVHLVEARRKRASFLAAAARAMGLKNVEVHGCREEDLEGPEPAVLTARAFAAPIEVVEAAERWGATTCLVGSSRARLPKEGWPPEGWMLHVEHPEGEGRFHALLVRSS